MSRKQDNRSLQYFTFSQLNNFCILKFNAQKIFLQLARLLKIM